MAKLLSSAFAVSLLCLLPGSLLAAEPEKPADEGDAEAVEEAAANTTLVWFSKPVTAEQLEGFAKFFDEGTFVAYPDLGGFAVRLHPSEAERRVPDVWAQNFSIDPKLPEISLMEEDFVVHGFNADCGDAATYPAPGDEFTPPGVDRVNGPQSPSGRVWIVDSGIAGEFDVNELNVNRGMSRECTAARCFQNGNDTAKNDRVGHGTFIAGIIGAIDDDDGLVGVAPNAELIAVQVFRKRRPVAQGAALMNALSYVKRNAMAGDVVNISWGYEWDPNPQGLPRRIENLLRTLADAGVKIAIAAGNIDTIAGSGYVQTVSPARIGGYSMNNGAIFTVSAVESVETNSVWEDTFWNGSYFGNGTPAGNGTTFSGPPNFAEPGVNITSLWPGPNIADCTGTSFSAAHMSGILSAGMPKADGSAVDDPSAVDPATGAVDPYRQDPVGVY